MSVIDKELGVLSEYFVSMEKMATNNNGETINVIKVSFPTKWKCFGTNDRKIDVGMDNNIPHIWWVYGKSSVVSFDEITAHVKELIQFNIELDDKKILFKEKAGELKTLFANYDLKTLQTLVFKYKEPRKKGVKKETKKEEKVEEGKVEKVIENKDK